VGYINNTVIIYISNESMSETNVNYRSAVLSTSRGRVPVLQRPMTRVIYTEALFLVHCKSQL